jgi:hypothetical protein
MAHLKSKKQGSWKNDLQRKKVLIMRRLFPHNKMGCNSYSIFHDNTKWMENSSNGCEDYFLE